jgi:hypothetical protein
VTVAAAPDTAPGLYTVPLSVSVSNPGGALFAPLANDVPDALLVTVEEPPPGPPAELPAPFEDRSINLLPVRGDVFVRYPGAERAQRLVEPMQVPPQTGVNAADGFVTLLSDGVGTGVAQSATLWDGSFQVRYTRDRDPLSPGTQRAGLPITELSLRGAVPPCAAGRARASARRRGRGLWGRGKGRFRTRGHHGAATVRGTHWRTGETCEGTLFRVRSGRVVVADIVAARNVVVRRGQSYLARRPGLGRARG